MTGRALVDSCLCELILECIEISTHLDLCVSLSVYINEDGSALYIQIMNQESKQVGWSQAKLSVRTHTKGK